MRSLSALLFFLVISWGCKKNKDTPIILPITGPYVVTSENVNLIIDDSKGARISSAKINGTELLYVDQSGGNNNWGSTFWPSPQTLFNWPPPPALDNLPYHNLTGGTGLSLQSSPATTPVLTFEKTFIAYPADTSISITYRIDNPGSNSISVAPWEITRVPSGGLIFYPNEAGAIPTGALATLTKDSSSIIWFDYDSTNIPTGTPKLYGDGSSEGWLAYVNNNRQLVIKKFTDTPLAGFAPSTPSSPESEIEIYTDPSKKYTELEEQGPYASIASNGFSTWTVKWYVRTLPAGVTVNVGSASLLAYVRSVIN